MASGGLFFSYLHHNSQSLLIIFVHLDPTLRNTEHIFICIVALSRMMQPKVQIPVRANASHQTTTGGSTGRRPERGKVRRNFLIVGGRRADKKERFYFPLEPPKYANSLINTTYFSLNFLINVVHVDCMFISNLGIHVGPKSQNWRSKHCLWIISYYKKRGFFNRNILILSLI